METMEEIKLIPRKIREAVEKYSLGARHLLEQEQQVYEEKCKQFKSEKARKTLNISRNGSNLFKVLFLNQIGIRTATLPELDLIVDENDSFLRGHYEDAPSVVLRSAGDSYQPNDYLAKSLAKLIKKRKFNHPIVINGLTIVEDDDSAYGLSFKLTDKSNFFETPELSHVNNQTKFFKLDERGIPVFDKEGNRTLYTKESGLSRLLLSRDLDLYSDWNYLAYSDSNGRVVVVSGEATSQKILNEYTNKLKQERDRQITETKDRYLKAQTVLRGE